MKRTKLLNIISSMLIGVIFMIAMLLVMIVSGAITVKRTALLFSTESSSAVYDGKPLTNHTWHLESGELKAGHRASVTFTGEQTSAGESDNTIQVQIFDAAGADVTGDYSISYRLGTLKVTPRTLSVKSKGGSKVYDGIPLVNPDYTVSSLVAGHNAIVIVTGSQTSVGFSSNTISMVTVLDRAGRDVTNNYQITKTEEPLIVTDGQNGGGSGGSGGSGGNSGNTSGGVDFGEGNELIGSDTLKDIILYRVFSDKTGRVYLKNKSFGDYTGNGFGEAKKYTSLLNEMYSASYLTSFALEAKNAEKGNLLIQRQEGSAYALPYYMSEKVYSGYRIQQDDVESVGTASQYTVDYYLGEITPAADNVHMYRDYEAQYRSFVYSNYLSIDAETLSYMQRIMESEGFSGSDPDIVKKVAEFIQASAEYDMAYDRGLDESSNIAVSFLRDYKTGVCRHYAMAATMLYRALGIPARYTVGAVADAQAGEWVDVSALQAHAWVEVYIDGIGWQMVEVTGGASAGGTGGSGGEQIKPDKKISLAKVTKRYDGTPLYAEAILADFSKYAEEGYTYENLVVSGSRTEVGVSTSKIESIVIYDKDGNDVTAEFELGTGKIHVYYWEINVISNGSEFEYGDIYAQNASQNITITGDGVQAWHTYSVNYTANYSVGDTVNSFSFSIKDEDGKNVGDQYKINITYGKLSIKHREITVSAESATKSYDGTPLMNANYSITGALAVGETVYICVVEGSQTNIGRSDNIISDFVIHNSKGEDVTKNYNVKMEKGELRVTR